MAKGEGLVMHFSEIFIIFVDAHILNTIINKDLH